MFFKKSSLFSSILTYIKENQSELLMKPVHEQLREFFKERGMSQVEVAETLGMTKSAVNKYFLGYNKFGKGQAEKWHEAFGISKSFLLTGEGSIVDEEPTKQIDGLLQTISDLNSVITEKNKTIANLKAYIAELETKLNSNH